jgi:hypothetical protein
MAKTYEIFTTKYSTIIQAVTPGVAEDNFWNIEKDESIEIIAIIELERGQEFIKRTGNCTIFDVMPMFADDSNAGNEKRDNLIEQYKNKIPNWTGTYSQGFADCFNWIDQVIKAN